MENFQRQFGQTFPCYVLRVYSEAGETALVPILSISLRNFRVDMLSLLLPVAAAAVEAAAAARSRRSARRGNEIKCCCTDQYRTITVPPFSRTEAATARV